MSKVDWTSDLTLVLIEHYEVHPCLYDPKHKFYADKHARNDALLKITEAIQLKEPRFMLEDIKKKITNIRSQFAHENSKILASQKSGMGSDELYEPSVWWHEKLLFLGPHVKRRKSKSTLDSMHIEYIDNQSQEESQTLEDMDTNIDSISSDNSTFLSTPKTGVDVAKKRKLSNKEITDPVMEETLKTLRVLGTRLSQNQNSTSLKSEMQIYAEYIAAELQDIADEELIVDAKHEINNIVYATKKKWLESKRQAQWKEQNIFILDNDHNV